VTVADQRTLVVVFVELLALTYFFHVFAGT